MLYLIKEIKVSRWIIVYGIRHPQVHTRSHTQTQRHRYFSLCSSRHPVLARAYTDTQNPNADLKISSCPLTSPFFFLLTKFTDNYYYTLLTQNQKGHLVLGARIILSLQGWRRFTVMLNVKFIYWKGSLMGLTWNCVRDFFVVQLNPFHFLKRLKNASLYFWVLSYTLTVCAWINERLL